MLISIITATYNSAAYLQEALNTFKNQDYKEKELIVVDGESKDQTSSIIQENINAIAVYVSESDQGIYDALNKGIALATGEVIGILHSDDIFASSEVLKKVAAEFKQDPKVMAVYGDLEYVKRDDPHQVIRLWKSGFCSRNRLNWGWMPPHPALFIRKSCFNQFGKYQLKYKSAADYDLILRFLFKNKIKTAYVPKVFVKMRVGGLSNQSFMNRWRANQEDRAAMKENGVFFPLLASFWKPVRKLSQFWK